MRQTLHIFKKDVREWAYEIVVALLLVAAFAAAESRPYYVNGPNVYVDSVAHWWAGALRVLLIASWWFLSAKVVQSEAIPGDRQFWLTRPYSWMSLLAAKTAFLVVFICLPMMLSDAIVLHAQGFPVLANGGGILWEMLLRFDVIVLSSMLLACLTRHLAGFSIVSVIVVLAMLVDAGFHEGVQSDPGTGWLVLGFALPLVPMAIMFQYARRKKIALTLAICAWLIPLVGGDIEARLSHPALPVKPAGPELAFTMDSRPVSEFASQNEPNPSEVRVVLPIEIAGIPANLEPWWHAFSVTLISPATQVWMSSENAFIRPSGERGHFWIEMTIPKDFYDEATRQTGDVAIHAWSDVGLYRHLHSTTVIANREFAVPEFGYCGHPFPSAAWEGRLECRAALRRPAAIAVGSEPEQAASHLPAEIGISPIVMFNVNLDPQQTELVTGEPVFRRMQAVDLPPIRLEHYSITQK